MSHPKFHVGELARMLVSDCQPQLVGLVCEIVQPLRERVMNDAARGKVSQLAYVTKFDGIEGLFGCQEFALGKIFEPGDWLQVLQDVGYQPDRRVRIPLLNGHRYTPK